MSFLVKFWGSVFELFFYANEYFIQWCDTILPYLSVINLHLKLDFRLIVKDFSYDDLDATTGELTRQSSTTSSKMNTDFIKSALTTKSHLNAALKRMSYNPPNKIKTVVAPHDSNYGIILYRIRHEYCRQKEILFLQTKMTKIVAVTMCIKSMKAVMF
ncbi:hypothetical protein BD770DRAFT_413479 [Pilaira anomala]|nr:hypothetical protein BD770DRAFT_413479 [Pilaira anomala]